MCCPFFWCSDLSAVRVRLPLLVFLIWQFCSGADLTACVAQDLYIGTGSVIENCTIAFVLIVSSRGYLVLYKNFLPDQGGPQSVTPYHVTLLKALKDTNRQGKLSEFVKCFLFFISFFLKICLDLYGYKLYRIIMK